ncbi:RING-box protein 2 [Danaus plexippus plexippus]|uniref:RING-box protein 2 n=1 Tax=Danaus plexippus plexippus TaxID=278856 RepID=A0A212FBA2_DANPL|nr:RING-box protein 2 [Danaus plexippus plexippus]
MFTLKKWNAVAMWSWDVECDTCAICRVQVMGVVAFSWSR